MKIWEKYILREFLKIFALFLFGFYFLYAIIDYSTHIQEFAHGKNLPILKIFQYYFFQFVKRADILIPLAVLLGTIKVLCQLNINRELVAFQSAGIAQKKLLRPLFLMGTLCTLSCLAINEFAIPHSLNFIDKFYDSHLSRSQRANRKEPFHVLHLEDHTRLVYQYFDQEKDALFDVIWIRSADDIWRMKYLKADSEDLLGQWVDHLVRVGEGFQKEASYPTYLFTEINWTKEIPRKGYIPYENRSIHELIAFLRQPFASYEKQEILTQLLFKLAMPTSCFLVLIGVVPFCIGYRRDLSPFFIYVFALFGFIAFVAFMDAAVILSENETASAYVAILAPFAFAFSIFGWRYVRV
ncbi:MAG: LptF/LptG family permease [Verrucomicrobia bacterium]|nr:LptF/LptG family permease [Verrucomicrobiota bacterium]